MLVLLVSLTACGGGGSSGGAAPRNPAPNPSNLLPTAVITATPTNGTAPLLVTLDASGSSDPDGTLTSFVWNFGDGSSGNGATVQHTYADVGTFTARVTVGDDDGGSASTSVNIVSTGFTLSGTIRIQASSAIDSDVNDTLSTPIPNNTPTSAQLIPNPATVGGYVTAPGSGEPGAVSAAGDTRDLFRFSAVGGETILLSIADAGEDLDLRLLDSAGNELDNSLGVTSTEVIGPITNPGEYIIQVETFGGAASNYVLTLGNIAPAAVPTERWSSYMPLASDEVILGPLQPDAPPPAADLPIRREDAQRALGGRARIEDTYASRIQRTAASRSDAVQAARLRTLSAIKQLHASGRYRYVEPNWIRQAFLQPNDQFFRNQWHYRSIKLPQAWDITVGDPSVIVAVIDTGILSGHPEFAGQLVPGFDFISNPASAADGDGIDADPEDPGDGGLGGNSSFHGTHVAGTVAARTDNANPPTSGGGVAGTAWNARIMPLRVLGLGGGTAFDVRQAMLYAAGLPNASGTVPAQRADIINLSLGGRGGSQADQDVVTAVRAQGVIVIAAAGNSGSSAPNFPAAYDGVVSVAATSITDRTTFYSSFGSTIDVAAPGGDVSTDVNGDGIADGVISTIGDDSDGNPATPPAPRIGVLAGTSMAAPHVAGVAALMRSVNPAIGPAEFDALLISGAITEDLGATGRDDFFGHGLINAQKAVVAAGSGATAPILIATPASLNFGAFAEEVDFRLANAGNGSVTVTSVTVAEPWLTVTPQSVDATQLGIYRASVDRSLLPGDGVFTAEIQVTSDANPVNLPVLIQRATEDLSANAGTTFVILTEPGGGVSLLPEVVVQANQGQYAYSIPDVPAGTYEITAGSDSDNDLFLCDPGESCGIFPTVDAPEPITVDGDVTNLDFVTAFRAIIDIQAAQTERQGEDATPQRRRAPPP